MSTDFTITGDKAIKKALQKIGAVAVGETVPSDELSDCRDTLNILIKNMMAGPNPVFKGLKTWQRSRESLTLSSSASYELKPSGGDLNTDIPVKMISVRLKDTDDNETPLRAMLLEEYENIPNKAQTTQPSRYYYEKGVDVGTLYFDCIPEDTTDTAELTFLRALNDIDDADDGLEFPVEYYRPLVNLLAVELAPEYDLPVPDAVAAAIQNATELVNSFEPEDSESFFQPEVY